MARRPSSKKVARAARTGAGSRRARGGSRSYFWPGFIAAVVVLGTLGIYVSREERTSTAATLSAPSFDRSSPPQAGEHWHAAYGVFECDKFVAPIDDQVDPVGIHTHADGVIHIHPFGKAQVKGNPFTGKNANLNAFFRSVDGKISRTQVSWPGHKGKSNGDKCKGKSATWQVVTWNAGEPEEAGKVFEGNPANLRPTDRMLITLAFVPKGTKIPRPPTEGQLDRLTDVGQQGAPPEAPTGTPPAETPPTGAPAAPAPEAPAPEPGTPPSSVP